jgi:hypothetical protein
MKYLYSFLISCVIFSISYSQNVGIGTVTPNEKLNVDSGNIRIGKNTWFTPSSSRFLLIGDGDFISLGESEGDDILTIRAKELELRPSTGYNSIPIGIQGTNNYSHFFYGTNEDTYIRGGKNNSNVIINDIAGGKVGIGMGNPTRAGVEQQGVVGTTAAIFGGEGSGISLQRNWPVVGFNHWFDGTTHRSIGAGYSGMIGLDQTNGAFYFTNFQLSALSANQDMLSGATRVYINNGRIGIRNPNPQADIDIMQNGAQSNSFTGIKLSVNTTSDYWNIFNLGVLEFAFNGAVKSYIAGDGTYVQISDKAYKRNISNISNNTMLAKINALSPVKYNMKDEKENAVKHFGFISQDVEQVFPELISENQGIKMMNYTGLIPILTKGMQEQQQEIDAIVAEKKLLEERIHKLESIVAKLQK